MTKTCAKTGDRETLKDGIVSKLQRHIVLQRKLLSVIHLFLIAVHDKRLLDPVVLSPDVYVCFISPGTPPCQLLHV